jgi:hypothetical protein
MTHALPVASEIFVPGLGITGCDVAITKGSNRVNQCSAITGARQIAPVDQQVGIRIQCIGPRRQLTWVSKRRICVQRHLEVAFSAHVRSYVKEKSTFVKTMRVIPCEFDDRLKFTMIGLLDGKSIPLDGHADPPFTHFHDCLDLDGNDGCDHCRDDHPAFSEQTLRSLPLRRPIIEGKSHGGSF